MSNREEYLDGIKKDCERLVFDTEQGYLLINSSVLMLLEGYIRGQISIDDYTKSLFLIIKSTKTWYERLDDREKQKTVREILNCDETFLPKKNLVLGVMAFAIPEIKEKLFEPIQIIDTDSKAPMIKKNQGNQV